MINASRIPAFRDSSYVYYICHTIYLLINLMLFVYEDINKMYMGVVATV
jgi:hypothetical protein